MSSGSANHDGAIVGLDIGGTKTHAVAFDQQFNQLAEHRVRTGTGGVEAVTASVLGTLAALQSKTGTVPITRIGIGIPGLIDPRTGSVRQAVNLGIGDEPLPIVDDLTAAYNVSCRVENDVNVASLGAYELLHRDLNIRDLAYLSIGTGIAAGVILNGRIHRGQGGVAGEIGHLPVVADGPECECGLRGCLEAVASGSAIARLWPSTVGAGPAEALILAANGGDEAAIQTLEAIADRWAGAVHLLAVTFDVDRIVIGGGVADIGEPLLDSIKAGLRRLESRSDFQKSLELPDRVILKSPGAIGAIGAAALTGLAMPR